MSPAEAEVTPSRSRLFGRCFLDVVLLNLVAAIVYVPFLVYAEQMSEKPTEARRDVWDFATMPPTDDALLTWTGAQKQLRQVQVERQGTNTLFLQYRTADRWALTPSWDSMGYTEPYFRASDVTESLKEGEAKQGRSGVPPTFPGWLGILAGAIIGACFLLWRYKRARERKEPVLDIAQRPRAGWPKMLISAAAVLLLLGLFTSWAISALHLQDAAAHWMNGLVAKVSMPTRVLLLLTVVIALPLVEELLFRGLVFSRFRGYGYALSGAVLSAGVFAVAHGIPVLIPYYFCFGLVLAWLCHRTGSLWPAIWLHMLWNGAVVVAEVIGSGGA